MSRDRPFYIKKTPLQTIYTTLINKQLDDLNGDEANANINTIQRKTFPYP